MKESRDFVRADMFDTGFKISKDASNPAKTQVCFITQVNIETQRASKEN